MDESQDPVIFIEFPERPGLVQASLSDNLEEMQQVSQKALNIAMSSIRAMAYKVSRTIHEFGEDITPNEVEVEFSLKLEFEGGVDGGVIPLVATTTTGGQFTVRFKWTMDKPDQAKVLVSNNP